MILLDSPTTSKESNKKYDTSNNNEENRSGEEGIAKEVKVLTVSSLYNTTSYDQKESREREEEIEEKERILDALHAGLHDHINLTRQRRIQVMRPGLCKSLATTGV